MSKDLEPAEESAFTAAEIAVSAELHADLNEVLLSLKAEQFDQEELKGRGEELTEDERVVAYGRVAKPLMVLADKINKLMQAIIFEGSSLTLSNSPVFDDEDCCDGEECCDSTSDTSSA